VHDRYRQTTDRRQTDERQHIRSRSLKMVAMETYLSFTASAISAFYWPTTQTPSITNCLVAIVHTMSVIAIVVPKLVAMATSLSTCGPPSNTWFLYFLGTIQTNNPNCISIYTRRKFINHKTNIFTFRSHREIFIRRSWYSVLSSLDATISCGIKKVDGI